MIDRRQFVRNLGFVEDPFAYTNADKEERLSEYFVQPPYFPEAFGDPDNPESFIVFAPRGGGKTAQRRMMEKGCAEKNVLALTYDDFDVFPVDAARDIKLVHHIGRILRIGYLGLLVTLDDDGAKKLRDQRDRSMIAQRAELHVDRLSLQEFESTLKSLRSMPEKAARFLKKYQTIIGTAANSISKRVLQVSVAQSHAESTSLETMNAKYELDLLSKFAQKVGFSAVYVLIDRVDESELTGNSAPASFELIESMFRSIHLLELDGIAFKFFLWDEIESEVRRVVRPDRVKYRTLKWEHDALKMLLQRRLKAFSDGSVRNLSSISEQLPIYDLDELAVIFAKRSPRDLIRVCGKILAEQQQLEHQAIVLGKDAISKGVSEFCSQIVLELYDERQVQVFRRIGAHNNHVDFTTRYLASEIFKKDNATIRPKIKKWRDEGYIENLFRIQNVRNSRGRSVLLYGMRDIRLARHMVPGLSTDTFLESKVRACPNCRETEYLVRDWAGDESSPLCQYCGYDLIEQKADPNFTRIDNEEVDVDTFEQETEDRETEDPNVFRNEENVVKNDDLRQLDMHEMWRV